MSMNIYGRTQKNIYILCLRFFTQAMPIFLINSRSHEEPIDIAHGKQAEDFPEVESPLTPFGPSDIFILGISFFSILLVYQELKPLKRETFSSRVNVFTI